MLFAGAMSQGTVTFACPHDGCTYSHWTKAGISGHYKKHVGGAAVAAAAAAAPPRRATTATTRACRLPRTALLLPLAGREGAGRR